MAADTQPTPSVLSQEQLAHFRENGFVRVPGALPREPVLEMQDLIWAELRDDHGIDRADPSTWTRPPRSPRRAKHHPLNEKLASDRLEGAISDVLGTGDWRRPPTWGGFLVTFPSEPNTPWDVPADMWHWDGLSGGKGLLVFASFGQVRPGGGGTLVVRGSHRLIDRFYESLSPADLARAHKVHRKMLSSWDPWLAALTGRSTEPAQNRIATFMERTTEVQGVPCRVVELTGEPGDAVLCSLNLLHSPAPNRSNEPRFSRVKFLALE